MHWPLVPITGRHRSNSPHRFKTAKSKGRLSLAAQRHVSKEFDVVRDFRTLDDGHSDGDFGVFSWMRDWQPCVGLPTENRESGSSGAV